MHTSVGGPKSVQCFYRQSADETLGQWIDVRGYAHVVFYITGNGTTSSGVITLEEAAPEDFGSSTTPPVFGAATDGYAPITTYNASNVSGGLQGAVHLPVAAYCFVRPRISTVIGGGGTISAGLVAY